MLKLLKYEFRKTLTAILVLLGLTAAMEGYFLFGLHSLVNNNNEVHFIIAMFGLIMCTYAAVIYVLVTGVTTYSKEMKDRSAYLIFMTPNSGLKIMGSKFIFAFVNAVLFAALYCLLGYLDIMLSLKAAGEYEEFLTAINEVLLEWGIHLDQILLAVLVMAAYLFLSILSFMALTYLAITLSHTLFRDKKWRGLAAIAIFIGLNWLVSRINGMLPSVMDTVVIQESAGAIKVAAKYGIQTTPDIDEVLLTMLPQAGVSLGVILVSLFGCAWMLDKKVSL